MSHARTLEKRLCHPERSEAPMQFASEPHNCMSSPRKTAARDDIRELARVGA